jgi:hypothetical protein
MSDKVIREIFTTRCYDEREDDPWIYLRSPSQDALAEEMKPLRVTCCRWVARHLTSNSWYSQVAFDPCFSLLARTAAKQEELQVAAMGKSKWMSKKSARKGPNLRAPATARTQVSHYTLQVHWTPVFARGKVHVFVLDPAKAADDVEYPTKLNNSENLGKFIRNVLPDILEAMKRQHGWSSLPRTLVHDKASYMVSAPAQRLNAVFARAVHDGGFHSWVGGVDSPTNWLCGAQVSS